MRNLKLFSSNKGAASSTFNPSESFAYPNASQKSADTIYEGASSSTLIPSESFASQNERQKSTDTSYGTVFNTFTPLDCFESQNEGQNSTDIRYGSDAFVTFFNSLSIWVLLYFYDLY
ncbi:uncharacterized protein LOC124806429 [Hydra vulgaris]|uniref:uncharacterized protein LOC124806429 n=1 Tax=Hydra vulgaris TaxID=6087 RepID=UPI0032E9ED8A